MALTISFSDLSIVRDGRRVLDRVTGRLETGALTVLVGPNGAGKSTLLEALAGLLPLTGGRAELDGLGDIATLNPAERARRVAWSPAVFAPAFGFTCRDVVMLGRYPWHQGRPDAGDRERADTALQRLGALDLADRVATTLSSGELQRVGLARVFAGDAEVLLLDEPVANLDVAAALAFLALLKEETRRGRTVCLTLHDLTLAHRCADHAIILREGRVAAQGPREQSLTGARIDEVFNVKSEIAHTAAGRDVLVVDVSGGASHHF